MQNQRGFTLVELLIGMAILGIVLAAVFSVLSSSVRAQLFGFSQERSHTMARQVMQAVSDELRYSKDQVIANNGSRIDYTRINPETGASETGSIVLANGTVTITRAAVVRTLGEGLIVTDAANPLFAHPALTSQYQVTVKATSQRGGASSTTTLATTVWTGRISQ